MHCQRMSINDICSSCDWKNVLSSEVCVGVSEAPSGWLEALSLGIEL